MYVTALRGLLWWLFHADHIEIYPSRSERLRSMFYWGEAVTMMVKLEEHGFQMGIWLAGRYYHLIPLGPSRLFDHWSISLNQHHEQLIWYTSWEHHYYYFNVHREQIYVLWMLAVPVCLSPTRANNSVLLGTTKPIAIKSLEMQSKAHSDMGRIPTLTNYTGSSSSRDKILNLFSFKKIDILYIYIYI